MRFISTLSERRWCRCYSLFLSLWNRVLLGKYTVSQSAEKLFLFYGRERFIIVFRTGAEITATQNEVNWVNALTTFSSKILLGAFAKRLRKANIILLMYLRPSVRPSVRKKQYYSHRSRFSCNWILVTVTQIGRNKTILRKIGQGKVLYMKICIFLYFCNWYFTWRQVVFSVTC